MKLLFPTLLSLSIISVAHAQQTGKPEDTEVYEPVPKVVTPGPSVGTPPSDALILFNGKDLSQWVSVADRNAPAKWTVADGILTVDKTQGNI